MEKLTLDAPKDQTYNRIDHTANIDIDNSKILNINIGMLGHIDSGKTSLCKALSTIQSTAGFDKNPQSQERGITLDLGFSAFMIEMPEWFVSKHPCAKDFEYIMFTLVDCPGHASLIKTIIGGASIIDFMILVIDSQKGIQTQTAECIVIGEMLMSHLILALNKIDQYPEQERDKKVGLMKSKLSKVFTRTKFGADVPIFPISAANMTQNESDSFISTILQHISYPERLLVNDKFLFAIDHCFQIKGQGTVLTGTILSGQVSVGQTIELPTISQERKVKSMQIFRKPVKTAKQGDRVGICVPQLDQKLIERGIACEKNTTEVYEMALVKINKIGYYKGDLKTKQKFHITVGHQTVIGVCTFFGQEDVDDYDKDTVYSYIDNAKDSQIKSIYAVIHFEKAIISPVQNTLIIASKLDTDIKLNQCRLAFYGNIHFTIKDSSPQNLLSLFKISKPKQKEGTIDRIQDQYTIIGKDLFKKESNIAMFAGMEIEIEHTKAKGRILGSFGKIGKFKCSFTDSENGIFGNEEEKQSELEGAKLILRFKKLLFDSSNKMIQ